MVSKTVDKLISKYGSIESIPREVLEDKGLVLFKGRIRSIANLNERQLAEALGINELKTETEEKTLKSKIIEIEYELKQRNPNLSKHPEFAKKVFKENRRWIKLIYDDIKTMPASEVINSNKLPLLKFASFANNKLQDFKPYLIGSLEKALDEALIHDEREYSEIFEKSNINYLIEQLNQFINSKEDRTLLKEEFTKRYGKLPYGETPFLSWAFKRQVLGEANPVDFYGKSLLTLYHQFVEKAKDKANASELAKTAFFYDNSSFAMYFEGSEIKQQIKYLSEFLSDHIPDRVKNFEIKRTKVGSAIAYLEELFYNYETLDEETMSILEKIQLEEFSDWSESPIGKKTAFLDDFVKSKSKKLKIIALYEKSKQFKKLVDACVQGDASFVDRIESNALVTSELNQLGVNTGVFYSGIPSLEFLVENTKVVNKDVIKKEKLSLYQTAIGQLFSEDILRDKSKLEAKIHSELQKDEATSSINKEDIVNYLLNLNDEEAIRKICRTSIEYLSRKQNVTDTIKANVIAFHLTDVNSFMKGNNSKKANTLEDNLSSSYSIKLASKSPFTDIDIGNDGGCCIGLYSYGLNNQFDDCRPYMYIDYLKTLSGYEDLEFEDGNGQYMPFYLEDRATQFVEIYKAGKRVGMSLLFAGKTKGTNESCLIVNSIELSKGLKEDTNKDAVIEQTINYIKQYAANSGFKHVVMSDHSYNPASTFGKEKIDFSVSKIHPSKQEFYSDNLKEDGNDKVGSIWKRI